MANKMSKEKTEKKEIPEYKTNLVRELADKMKKSRTILIASTKSLPSSQFHEIKKNIRDIAEIRIAKKSIVIRAVESTSKPALQKIKENISADIALFFSQNDPFELSALLSESKSPARAKAGDIAIDEIRIEPGPTNLVPGPAISELSGAGLKVAVEGGKLTIKQGAVVAKAGEPIKENVASVLAKLDIKPMKVGFEPIAAYDSSDEKIYINIKIDKKATLDELKINASKSFGFAVRINYLARETVSYFISRASLEEKVISRVVNAAGAAEIS